MRRIFFLIVLLAIIPQTVLAQELKPDTPLPLDSFSDLNLRFSNRPLTPPKDLTVEIIPLTGLSVAPSMVAPSPQAIIMESSQRQRVAILSMDSHAQVTLYLLEPLPLDPKLSTLVQCAHVRNCQADRTPLTGGLGCLGLCLKELLESVANKPFPR